MSPRKNYSFSFYKYFISLNTECENDRNKSPAKTYPVQSFKNTCGMGSPIIISDKSSYFNERNSESSKKIFSSSFYTTFYHWKYPLSNLTSMLGFWPMCLIGENLTSKFKFDESLL